MDSLRGVAIGAVLLFHFGEQTGADIPWLSPVFTAGWAGVDLFFVLSGFLVGRLILIELADTGGFDRTRFLVRRCFRLWPVLYLYLLALGLSGYGWSRLMPAALHLQNYVDDGPWHLWSLAVEE
ncbi:hypothetical protein B0B24_30975, partial [Pseudomonas aeruginosa]